MTLLISSHLSLSNTHTYVHQNFVRSKPSRRPLNVHAFDNVVSGQMEQIEIDEIENEVQKSQFLAINVNAIRKIKKQKGCKKKRN